MNTEFTAGLFPFWGIIEVLKRHFPNTWESLHAMSVVRLIDPVQLKSLKERWEKLHISTILHPQISPNTLTDLLARWGNINMAQKGHNADHEYIPQLNLPLSLIWNITFLHSCSILSNSMDHPQSIYLMYKQKGDRAGNRRHEE